MPGLKKTSYGTGDPSWLGSAHGIRNSRTGTVVAGTFTSATHYPNGYLRSGEPVNAADEGNIRPWTNAAGERLGFILFDTPYDGTSNVQPAVFRHGTVKIAQLPVAFTRPTTGDGSGFVFIDGSDG